ncbi:MAG: right-handed parallel beta-helix repeat-containing protein [Candidatus Solibacter sp.]|nr:right-handed parallel beta-helix repeat-containing protein [Candidatus Solibacter sp.]
MQAACSRKLRRDSGSKRFPHCFCAFLTLAVGASAAVLRVGPGQQYSTPCRAIEAATPGDTIQVDAAGNYDRDGCGWTTNDLTIVGVNGRPRIDAAGQSFGGRAIWIISGNNTTVENIEFTGAKGPNRNGAAIQQLGANLTVRKCYVHGNEDGILTAENPTSHILIENTEFAENGYGDGQSHNIYIGRIARFTLRFSYSHDAISGHLVKSRALQNFILYNRLTGESGTSSYEVDLPNGGLSYVIGNVIEQGSLTENSTIVAYGIEGVTNPDSTLYFVNNTVVNDRWNGFFIRMGAEAPPALVQNNIFGGPGLVIDQPDARLSHNLPSRPLFVNPAEFDYHLKSGSPAQNFGSAPGTGNGYSLIPMFQYVHPTCFETRRMTGTAIDAGAFEIGGGGGADSSCSQPASLFRVILTPAVVAGGQASKGTLQLSGQAPAEGITLALSSSAPNVANVPASIVIPQGGTSAQFKIATTNVTTSTSVVISAGSGQANRTATLEVDPAFPALSSVTVPARSIVGGTTITGTVTLANPSPTSETAVTLISMTPDVAAVPSHVTFPAGSNQARFPIKIASVNASTRVTVGASHGGVTKTVDLTVTPRRP